MALNRLRTTKSLVSVYVCDIGVVMKQVFMKSIGETTSRIGFGCASLGSRIGSREGINALERAYTAGVTWYDVAPSYGDGMAESIVGEFGFDKRDRVHICTKVGMAPPRTPAVMRALKPLTRIAIAGVPTLKQYAVKVRPVPYKVSLTAQSIQLSVENSLRRLRTDYIDVLALHRPSLDELIREDIIRAIESLIQNGKARAVSVAGDVEAGLAALCRDLPYKIVQIANTALTPNLTKMKVKADFQKDIITYGTFSCIRPVSAAIESRREIAAALAKLGYSGSPNEVAAAFLADFSFATNLDGVTLVSMFGKEHLKFNLSRLQIHPKPECFHPVLAALGANAAA